MALLRALGLLALLFFVAAEAIPGTERYDYDPLGRLIRYVDSAGQVTEYVYDPVGNILAVRRVEAAPPLITSVAPTSLRRGESVEATIAGTGFTGATIQTDDPELRVTNLRASATLLSFTLIASATAAVGAHTVTVSNAIGSKGASISVNPLLPKVLVDPTPLAIPPDGVARPITIRLTNADTIDHVLALSTSNARATVAPASVTIPAGQTQATATITGISAGQATLILASATLGSTLAPVFITGEFRGLNTSFARPLGVVLEGGGPTQTPIGPIATRPLGVVVGGFLGGVAPRSLSVGSGPSTLTVSGRELQAAQSVTILPATGLTLGAVNVAPDGTSISVPVTVAPDAPVSPRRVSVSGPSGAFPVAAPDADRIAVVRSAPEILSIDPIFATPGTLLTLSVRGRNLHEALGVSLVPAAGLAAGIPPAVSADGTVLSTGVHVAAEAPAGPRTVVVTTPGGNSSATPSAANTFTVVNEALQAVTPVASLPVGVVLEGGAGVGIATGVFSAGVGVAVGSVVVSVSPTLGVVGRTTTLTFAGSELAGVSAVQFTPATGLTAGAVAVAADGRSLSVPVTIAPDAPQTLRAMKVLAGTAAVPFASPESAVFRVSAPAPVLESMTPIALQVGQPPLTLTIRGRDLLNAQQIRVLPGEGMTIGPAVVNAEGTVLTAPVSAAAGAALGPRAVTVVTPGGESSTAPGAENTLTLMSGPGTAVTPVTSPPLGVVKLDAGPPATTDIGPVVSPTLGVVLESAVPPPPMTQSVFGGNLGVAVGPVATAVQPNEFAPELAGTLTIRGFALDAVTGVSVNPATGVTLGAPVVAPDGAQVSVPIAVAAGAPAAVREVRLAGVGGRVPFADPAAARIAIGPGVPRFDSITPIVGVRGTSFTLTIRGAVLNGATAVAAEPSAGIAFSNAFTVDASGTQLDVAVSVAPDAPLGSRVIRVLVPGAASSATPSPANTFTVVAQ